MLVRDFQDDSKVRLSLELERAWASFGPWVSGSGQAFEKSGRV